MPIVFGIDAGLTSPGFALIQTDTDTLLFAECFIPKSVNHGSKSDFNADRVGEIALRIAELCDSWLPEVVIVELPTGGAKSAGAGRGMALSLATTVAALTLIAQQFAARGQPLSLRWITPMENKKGGLGLKKWISGADSKTLTLDAMTRLYPLAPWPMKKAKKNKPAVRDLPKCWAVADALSCVVTYARR